MTLPKINAQPSASNPAMKKYSLVDDAKFNPLAKANSQPATKIANAQANRFLKNDGTPSSPTLSPSLPNPLTSISNSGVSSQRQAVTREPSQLFRDTTGRGLDRKLENTWNELPESYRGKLSNPPLSKDYPDTIEGNKQKLKDTQEFNDQMMALQADAAMESNWKKKMNEILMAIIQNLR